MDFNYTLRYRTFDQLLEDVTVDFNTFALENMIEPQTLIKVARRLNYDLGLRINQTKEVVLEVCHGKVKLPDFLKQKLKPKTGKIIEIKRDSSKYYPIEFDLYQKG